MEYILGLPNSGKSFYCLNELITEQENGCDNALIYIVPEQYSLSAEYDLVKLSKNKGIIRASVLTFKRLAYHVLSETGFQNKKMLDDTGKIMLIRKIFHSAKNELKYYNNSIDKKGFIEAVSNLITAFFKYCISPETISKQLDNSILKLKLHDISIIFKYYLDFIENNYLSTDQLLDLLAENIHQSNLIDGANIWIDAFHTFTTQEYKIIKELHKKANRITLTLTFDPLNIDIHSILQTDPFYLTKNTFKTLNTIITKNIKILELRDNFKNVSDLRHLSRYFLKNQMQVYDKIPQNIRLIAAANRYDEIRDVSIKIIELVSKGYRYRDIAIITNSLADYEKTMKSVFDSYEIPFFYDSKKEIITYPLISLICALLDIINNNWSYESVFSYLKSGLSNLERCDVDLIENYCLAYGIRGKRWQKEHWDFGFNSNYESFNEDDINFIKDQVTEELQTFTDDINKGKKYTIKYITTKLVEFLLDLEIPNKLTLFIQQLEKNDLRLANENMQLWDTLMTIFDKLVEILGDETVTLSEYSKILNDAFLQNKIGSIPLSVDSVIIGDMSRTRLSEVKAVFLVGANESALFSSGNQNVLFTDVESNALFAFGLDFIKSNYLIALEEQFLLYTVLSKPKNFLNISYSLGDINGKPMYASIVIQKIKKMFPLLKEENIQTIKLISKPTPTLLELTSQLRTYIETGQLDDIWKDTYSWFFEHKKDKITTILDVINSSNIEPNLTKGSLKKLYNKDLYSSVSRLEKFIQCPFSYFIQYGLNVKERKLYQIQHLEMGILFHNVLENFSKKLNSDNKNWRQLDKKDIEQRICDSIDKIAPQIANEILLSSSRYMYLIKRLKRISSRSVWALAEHIKRGSFTPVAFELGFGVNETLPPIIIELSDKKRIVLTGRIDRVDIYNSDGKNFVKIIDYKSGNKKFNLRDVYYGIQLQLMLYLNELIKNGNSIGYENILPGGVFYFKIDDPLISFAKLANEDEIEELILKELKLSGLVLNNYEVITALDNKITDYSSIIPVKLKNDGTPTKHSSVADLEEFQNICDYVSNLVKDIGNEIITGNINISPVKDKNTSACNYCLYKSICRFDVKSKGNSYREFSKENDIKLFK